MKGGREAESQAEAEITLGMLNAVASNSVVTQRSLARELGIALGLANAYLKRCISKGYIKVSHVPARRYAYYLTPKGFAEKSRLTANYLSRSFDFFRLARGQCRDLLAECEQRGWTRIALFGASDLAEIARLVINDHKLTLVGLVDANSIGFGRVRVVTAVEALGDIDAVLITDLERPQSAYDTVSQILPQERILAPALLNLVRNPAAKPEPR